MHQFIQLSISAQKFTKKGFDYLHNAGPALGMFGVFSRTGPQKLGGGANLDHTKINLPVWTMWCLYGVCCHQIPDLTWAWIGFHFATHCNADWPKNQKCCNQMHFGNIQYSKMRLRSRSPGPHHWGSLQRSLIDPVMALQDRPRGPCHGPPKIRFGGPQCIWPQQ